MPTKRPNTVLQVCLCFIIFLLSTRSLQAASRHTIRQQTIRSQPTRSGPIIVDEQRRQVWVVNPDNNSVAVINADTLTLLQEIEVCAQPTSVALDNQAHVWLSCRSDDSVWILDANNGSQVGVLALGYGAQPVSIVFTPDGSTGYIAEYGPGRLTRLDAKALTVSGSLNIGSTPRALAISGDGQRLLATRFISADGAGKVWSVDLNSFALTSTLELSPDTTIVDSPTAGRGLPNYVAAIAIAPDNQQAWIVAIKDNILRGGFRDGRSLTFETTLRALVTRADLTTNQEMVAARLNVDNHGQPSAITLSPQGDLVFMTLQGNNRLLVIDPVTNAEITRADTGLAPQGVVIDPVTGRIFTQDLMSRTVTVFDGSAILGQSGQTLPVVATIKSVTNEKLAPEVLLGKQIFYNARDLRMAKDGYLSCAACHLDGEPDGQVWDFTDLGEGLRNTPDLRGRRGMGHGNIHWTANFDEIQDFELPIRFAFGGTGFMSDADLFGGTRLAPLGDPKAGFSAELDALAAYVATFEAVPRSPYRAADGSLTAEGTAGRLVFQSSGCRQCHPGSNLTDTTMHNVGTIKAGSGKRLGQKLTGIETPTLKGIWATAPYLHDGSAPTLADVFEQAALNSPHGLVRNLNETDLANLIAYLLQIDENICQNSPTTAPPAGKLPYSIYLPVILSVNTSCP